MQLHPVYIALGVIFTIAFILVAAEILSDNVAQDRLNSVINNEDTKYQSCINSSQFNQYLRRVLEQASKYGISGTPSFLINQGKIVGNQNMVVFENAIQNPEGEPIRELYEYDDIVFGDPNAPVWVVEFSSPLCPHCQRFHKEKFKEIYNKYISTGKVFWILKGASIFGRVQERELIGLVYCTSLYDRENLLNVVDRVFGS
ncbi:MAG: thioredoxin domain-containing protein [Candidatus Anstonellales archaeon]